MRCLSKLAALALAGCATVQPLPPPEALLATCPEPSMAGKTNGELAAYALALKHALMGCNRQLEALREWAGD